MTSRFNQSAEAWTNMIRTASVRWNRALELGRRENVDYDEWMGNAVGSWVAMIDGFTALSSVWLGSPPSEEEVPTLGIIVDSESGEAAGTLSRVVTSRVGITSTDLVSPEGKRISREQVSVASGTNVLTVSIEKIKNVDAGQYIGMLYQDVRSGVPPAVANVHLVKLPPRSQEPPANAPTSSA